MQRSVRRRRRGRLFIAQEENDDRGTVGEKSGFRIDQRRAGDLREVFLRNGALELLHQRRRSRPSYSIHKTGNFELQGSV